jgi:N-acetylmuramoyl-L-alanine amidase
VFGDRAQRDAPDHGEARRPLPLELRSVRRVVIDPGHGGRDPGAIGVGGVREKDVTLGLARRLRARLQARGFDAILTREVDRTLDLEERTAVAEGAGGDVFVSIHANSAPRHGVHGIEIYTLDEDSQRQTLRLAARENGVEPRDVDPLQRLLARLRLSETSLHSTLLAEMVDREIAGGMGPRWPAARQTSRKKGPFYVLYLSSVPSILVEVGFLTHREEARRLRDPSYLEAMAEEIADGLALYRDRLSPVVAEGGS